MPNVTRGDRMTGLLVYLAGPGRHNEHTDPHLVAGDDAVMSVHGGGDFDVAAARGIASTLDHPRRLFGTEVSGGSVWHCSLSVRAEEGQLSDEKWAAIAGDVVDRMGFTAASGRAACRWVAVRHGLSNNGNDHVHLVVSLVREDGTKADVWNDYARTQRICGDLEREHGLNVLHSRTLGRGQRGVHPGEVAAARRAGASEPARVTLARVVRAAATTAADEGDFVRRARQHGLIIRPRYATGRVDVVTGYSVAQRPIAGARPVWFGGGHLARDLTLPRLRAAWPKTLPTTMKAIDEWSTAAKATPDGVGVTGARSLPRGGTNPRGPEPVPAAVWREYVRQIDATRRRLRDVPVDDHATWAQVARDSAGVFASWSTYLEPTPGPLAATSDALARSAHLRAAGAGHVRAAVPRQAVRGAALLVAGLISDGNTQMAMAALLRQYANLAKAVHDAHAAAGDVRRARAIEAAVRHQLAGVARQLPSPSTPPSKPADNPRTPTPWPTTAADRPGVRPRNQLGTSGLDRSQDQPTLTRRPRTPIEK